jgi:hypothetical protein
MSQWWVLRVVWLALGLLAGVIVFLPESAKTLTGAVAVVFILAIMVLLGRWAIVKISESLQSAFETPDPNKTTLVSQDLLLPGASLQFEASRSGPNEPALSQSDTLLSRFRFGGFRFSTLLKIEAEQIDPKKRALMWDSVLFGGGILICAGLASLAGV